MTNPTTNYGWVMPTATDLVTDLPADFNVFGQAVDTSMAGLLGGTTGQILSKTSATNMAFTWIANDQGDLTGVTAGTGISVTSPTGPVPTVAIDTAVTVDKTTAQTLTNKTLTSPALTTPTISTATTNGDLLYGTGAGALSRLGIGSAAQVLTVAGGIPSWATPGAGKVVQIVAATYSTQKASSSAIYADAGLTATITPTSASNKVLAVFNQNGCGKATSDTHLQLKFLRDAVVLGYHYRIGGTGSAAENFVGSVAMSFLDAPASTSALTYKVQYANENATASVYVQKDSVGNTTSTMYLMEVTP